MTPGRIRIDPASGLAPYAQILDQVTDAARSGALPAGTRLPTVRALADELGVAVNTVARAYKELEAARVVETRGRHGTFVSAGTDALDREVFAAATAFVARVRRLGVSEDAASAAVREAFRAGS